jgi:hypothetical protein
MKVSLTITVDHRVANDIRVFYSKAMQGNESVACQHPLTMEMLRKLPAAIDNAASYQREIERIAAGGAGELSKERT